MVTVLLDLKAHILLDNNLAGLLRGILDKGHLKEVHMDQDLKVQALMDLLLGLEETTEDCFLKRQCCS